MRRSTVPRYGKPLKSKPKPKKQSQRKSVFKKTKWLIFALLMMICLVFSGLIWHDYQQSLDWTKNKNGLKMAEMSPDMLEDSPKQVAIKEDFIKKAQQLMQPNGQINVTASSLLALKHDLDQIKTAKPQYAKQYQKIAEKYQVQVALNRLFTKKQVTATTEQVAKTIADVSPTLNTIHQKAPHDKFVDQQMQIIHALNHDVKLIKQSLVNMSQLVTISNKAATFKPKIIYQDYQNAMSPQAKLTYKWSILTSFNDLQPEIKTILAAQARKISAFKAYQQDLRDKEQAYEDLRKARQTHAANNAQVIEQIRQDKLEKQRQKEEAAAERKRQAEEEKAAKQKHDTDNSESNENDNDQTNKNSHKNSNNSTAKAKNKKPARKPAKPAKKPKDHYVDPDDPDTDFNDDDE